MNTKSSNDQTEPDAGEWNIPKYSKEDLEKIEKIAQDLVANLNRNTSE